MCANQGLSLLGIVSLQSQVTGDVLAGDAPRQKMNVRVPMDFFFLI